MIDDPVRYIKEFADAGSDNITIHVESCFDPLRAVKQIKALGLSAGISIKPYHIPTSSKSSCRLSILCSL